MLRHRHIGSSESRGWIGKAAVLMAALVVSAFLMALAISSPTGRWLGWFTLLPLFFSIRVLSPVQAGLAGSVWGLAFAVFSATGPDAQIAFTLRSVIPLTLVPGLYAGLGAFLTRRSGFSPLILGLGWVGVELTLRPLALHHGLLASTQGNGLFIRTLGSVAGYVLVAFLVAYVNASLLEMLTVVCVAGGVPLRLTARGSGDAGRRLSPLDVPHYFLYLRGPVQPRAPPAGR